MDKTETYIKMSDCEEIQDLRVKEAPWDNWQVGDFYYTPAPITGCISVHNDASSYGLGRDVIWLPRQGRLQEMVDIPYKVVHKDLQDKIRCEQLAQLARDFARFVTNEKLLDFTSMEQLWLAFVMKEKFGRVWNGKEWE